MKKLPVALWSLAVPAAACIILAGAWNRPLGAAALALVAAALVAAVFAAVHHAEVVAHRVGEPFGTLVLALAVTVIEVALVVSMMLSGGPEASELARDTVFATVMIVCNGVVGLCLVAGALRHRELEFRVEGTGPALAVLIALTALTLVLPSYTLTTPGPSYSPAQLVFAGAMSLILWSVFVLAQTGRYREYFLPTGAAHEEQAAPPSGAATLASVVLLVFSLVAVIGLAKILSPSIRTLVEAASAPPAVVGIAIALIVLLPETVAAIRAAARNRMQTSLNLALGSALATIGLTIPAVAVVAIVADLPLALGLPPKEAVLALVTFVIASITLATGRASVMQGAVHLTVFAAFLFLAVIP